MSGKERKEILEAFRDVDKVILTGHSKNPKDMSVCKELLRIKPDIFANGGATGLEIPSAGATGLEPATFCVTGRRSNQAELRPRTGDFFC